MDLLRMPKSENYKKLQPLGDSKANINMNPEKFVSRIPDFIKSTRTDKVFSSSFQPAKTIIIDEESLKYGELIVLGHNGKLDKSQCLQHHSKNDTDRHKSKFVLKKRDKANGVKPATHHDCQSNLEINSLQKDLVKNNHHSVSYSLARNHTVVVEYLPDANLDMFQIGRSSEPTIDFIVLDTLQKSETPVSSQQSTISRFSCRITVDRTPPYIARIYAAGFDCTKNIVLGEKATKWKNEKGEMDGVTTNGVLIMHPSHGFSNNSSTDEWLEVSVCGAVFKMQGSRCEPLVDITGNLSNILRDGTLIDLCGATLIWRTTDSLSKTPTRHYLEMNLERLNKLKPQCPVALRTLAFPTSLALLENPNRQLSRPRSEDIAPRVYLACGHVHGLHNWGHKGQNGRECPLCRNVGPYVNILIGLESSFYCDTDIELKDFKPYAFKPCGHMASEKTCKYWAERKIPLGTSQGLHSVCPFCATPLESSAPYVRLIFQESVNPTIDEY